MIGRLNHVAVAVADLEATAAHYRVSLGARVSAPSALPEHGVTTAFVELANAKIELLQPLGPNSPIAKFLQKNPDGGVHHLCFEVDDILARRRPPARARSATANRKSAPTASPFCSCIPRTSTAR
jgi:methylmalonyl-CoA/ethylmalonyl-CoA epimerase